MEELEKKSEYASVSYILTKISLLQTKTDPVCKMHGVIYIANLRLTDIKRAFMLSLALCIKKNYCYKVQMEVAIS